MAERQTFGHWLEAELVAREMSQADLARSSGLHKQVISDFINNKSRRSNGEPSTPRPETIKKIARGLGLPYIRVAIASGIVEEDMPAIRIPADPNAPAEAYAEDGIRRPLTYEEFDAIQRENPELIDLARKLLKTINTRDDAA